jgi:hypothetical protein
LSEAPTHDELDIELMTYALTKFREKLTPDDAFVQKILGKKSPREMATEIIKNTTLKNPAARKALLDGGTEAIAKSTDPMIQLALEFDPEARAIRKHYEDDIESKIKKSDEKIAQAYFAINGENTYPDATFTLRLSYGVVKGFEDAGRFVSPITDIAGAYKRNTGKEPFALPDSWMKAEKDVNLSTPLNFCTTNDIIGGNSGSPVVNKLGEVVGLIFDGNIQSLGGIFSYDESVNRAVAVHSAGIMELLSKVYHADRIVNDLKSK